MPTVRVQHRTEAGLTITTTAPNHDPHGRARWRRNWGEDRAGASTPYRLTRFAVPIRGNGRWSCLTHRPEDPITALICALILVGYLSLITYSLITGELGAASLISSIYLGYYCTVLIRRRWVLAAAERARRLNIGRVGLTEPTLEVLRAEDWRESLDYFKYTPPGGEQGTVPTGGEAKPGGVGAALGGGFPVHSPPSSTHDITESCAHGIGVVSGSGRVWDVEAQMSTASTVVEASGSLRGLELPQVSRARSTEQSSIPASVPGAAEGVERSNSWQWSTAGACIVCFGEYRYGDDLCRLPCRHVYHAQCIDEWLDGANHAWCPLCKRDLRFGEEGSEAGGSAPSIANASTDTQDGNRGY